MAAKAHLTEALLAQFSNFLSHMMGLHYPPSSYTDFSRKLAMIASAFGFNHIPDCLEWLMRSPLTEEQVALLAEHLTVGETYFFRDKRTFAILENEILPRIIYMHRSANNKVLRLWSAGCASGEEPYSLAILLHRLLPDLAQWKITILATDINLKFLHKARQGHYKAWSFRSMPPDILKCYFNNNHDGSHSLSPNIRSMVTFNYVNLAENNYPSEFTGTQNFDLILCNNVLIYFSPEQISKSVAQLTQALSPAGWLVVSSIEVPFVKENSLSAETFDHITFFQKLGTKSSEKLQVKTHFQIAPTVPQVSVYLAPIQNQLDNTYVKVKAADELNVVVPVSEDYCAKIRRCADAGNMIEALNHCEQALEHERLNPELYYLQAIILYAMDDITGAVTALKRVIYLDSSFIIAHYLLGILTMKLEHSKEAERHLRHAQLLLQNSDPEAMVPGSENMNVATLLDAIAALTRG